MVKRSKQITVPLIDFVVAIMVLDKISGPGMQASDMIEKFIRLATGQITADAFIGTYGGSGILLDIKQALDYVKANPGQAVLNGGLTFMVAQFVRGAIQSVTHKKYVLLGPFKIQIG